MDSCQCWQDIQPCIDGCFPMMLREAVQYRWPGQQEQHDGKCIEHQNKGVPMDFQVTKAIRTVQILYGNLAFWVVRLKVSSFIRKLLTRDKQLPGCSRLCQRSLAWGYRTLCTSQTVGLLYMNSDWKILEKKLEIPSSKVVHNAVPFDNC